MPTITGTTGADVLTGDGADDVISGLGGNDTITGGGGNDSLSGGDGDDRFVFSIISGAGIATVVGGAGSDVLDLSAYDSARYFFNQPLTVGMGATPGTLSASAFYYQRGGGGTTATVIEASGIEHIVTGRGVGVTLGGYAGDLTVQTTSPTGTGITTGSGNDTVILAPAGTSAYGGVTVDTGAGSDTLVLTGGPGDYLFQKTATGWSVFDGRASAHTITGVEAVRFGSGTAMTFEAAAALDFDAEGYLARYADLRAVFGTDLGKAYQHYESWGQAEGRIGSFDALSYIASYGDLIRAFGTDAATGAAHYASNGQAEGRTITFNPADYAASHLDLARIFGTDAARAASHYITSGVNEGRATGGFDSVAYLLSHSDLAGKTPSEARTHWLTSGADEGRVGDALFGRDQTDVTFSGGLEAGRFETATDRDWFAITLPVYETLTFNGSAGVTGLALYNATGKLIAADADGRDFRVVITNNDGATGPASYYLVVSGGSAGDYTVSYAASRLGATVEAEAAMQSAAMKLAAAVPEPVSPAPVDDAALSGPWAMPAGDPDLFMA
ncbi:MAG: hypothetical protein K2X25_09385 [Caulobacteraceae bacterium]|nr:hypothetical protein [Caulobacteraceae bacterium]